MPPENGYYPGYYFYAPQGRFEPCGMFTANHIVSALICFIIVSVLIVRTRNRVFKDDNKRIIFKRFAMILTVLEIIKIAHSFIYGDFHLDAWFPLSYCGLFIFALWMAGFGKGRIKRTAEVFIAYGCGFAGLCFLVFPTTSLMLFPIWHYFSIYSMFYHSVMIYIGVKILLEEKKFSRNTYLHYVGFVGIFAIIAISINSFFGCNLMNLREPYNIPIKVLQDIYKSFQPAYTLVAMIIYMLVPLLMAFIFKKLNYKNKEKND